MNRGFTLIEIVAVIGILALLLLVVVPSINGILNRSKKNLNDEQIAQIENAARNWGLDNVEPVDRNNDGIIDTTNPNSVSIETLQKTGFLEDNTVKNLEKNSDLSTDAKVCIEYRDSQYVYKFNLEGDC